jgi:predicted PurR-regulated permease PerM
MRGDLDDPVEAAGQTPVAPEPAQAAADPGGAGGPPEWVARAVWRGIWQLIAAVLITLVALWFVRQARDLVRFLILSQLLAFALEPAVIWLHEKRGWRRGSATGLILVAILVLFGLLGGLLVPVLANGVSGIVEQVPKWIDQLNAFTQEHFHATVVSSSSSQESTQAAERVTNYLQDHAGDLLGAVGSLLGGIFSIFTVGLFTFYLTANGPKVRRALLARLPPERQERVLWAWNTAIEKTGGYLYSRGLLALINGGLMFLTLKLLGVPYALPLSLFVGVVAEFIPIVGTYIAGAVPVVVALASVGTLAAVVVLAEILVYQQLENYVLSPRISQKTMELNAGVAFAAAMAGGAIGGFIGAFFALPVAAVVQAFLSTYSRRYDVLQSDLTQVDPPATKDPRHGGTKRVGTAPQP